jgi:hypothetical protein
MSELERESIKKIQAEWLRSFSKWEELDGKVLEEDFEDTLERKYLEGYHEALAMVLDLLEEGK